MSRRPWLANWTRPLLLVTILATAAAVAPRHAHAQADDGWSVDGGSARDREIMRRYKVLLEKNPTEGLAFRKLLEMAGGTTGLDRLIEEYTAKADSAEADVATYHIILGHLYKAKDAYEEAAASYSAALDIDDEATPAYMGRGEAYTMLQKAEEASRDFEAALALADDRNAKQKILRKLADLAFAQRDWERAQRYYERLIELDPRNEFLRLEYAEILVKYKRYETALEQYDALIDLAGRDVKTRATTMRDKADLLEKMGRDEDALALYERAQRLVRPSNWLHREIEQRIVRVYRQNDDLATYVEAKSTRWRPPSFDQAMILAQLYDELGREEDAFAMYKRAMRRNQRAVEPRSKIIQILQRRGDHDAVIDAYEELIRIAPNEARFRFDLARILFRNGDRDRAEKILDRVERRFRRDTGALVQLADLYMRFGMREDALSVYKRLVRAEPGNDAFITSLGEYYYQQGETEKAIETWEDLLTSDLPTPQAHAQLGLVLVEHNLVERGIEHYEQAVDLDPDDPELQRGLAMAYELGRYWDKAIAVWTEIMHEQGAPTPAVAEARSRIIGIYKRQNRLRTKMREFKERFDADAEDTDAGFFLAESYIKLGMSERAEGVWRRIIDADGVVDTQDIPALMELERIYTKRGEHNAAIDILQRLAELRPEVARDYYQRIADLSLKAYEDAQAVRYAKLAIEANPNDSAAHAQLAEVYARMGREEDAIAEYRVALDLDPRAFDAISNLARLLLEVGREEEAARLYRVIASDSNDEAMILDAARRAMALARTPDQLEELERELGPLVFSSDKSIYRKIMLEVYGRLLAPLVAQRDFGTEMSKADAERLELTAERAFPVLMDAVQSRDIGQRQRAVRTLGELRVGAAALPLSRMVNDETEPLRLQALIAVALIGDERASAALARALDDPEPHIREAAAWGLGAVGDAEAMAALRRVVREGQNSRLRALAALSLGRIGDRSAVGALLTALKESAETAYTDPTTFHVAVSLGHLGDDRAISALQDLLASGRGESADAAAWALGQIGGDAAARALLDVYWSEDGAMRERSRVGLIQLVEEDSEEASAYRVYLEESRYLSPRGQAFYFKDHAGHLHAKVVFAPIIDPAQLIARYADPIASVARTKLTDAPTAVQRTVLADLADPDFLGIGASLMATPKGFHDLLTQLHEPLRDIATASQQAAAPRGLAIALLGRLGDAADRDVILGATSSEDVTLRARSTAALSAYASTPDVQRRLIALTQDPHPSVRAAAAASLVEHTRADEDAAAEVVAALTACLDDAYASVRLSAIEALGDLGATAAVPALADRLEGAPRHEQIAILTALGSMEAPAAVKVLTPYKTHHDGRMRRAAGAASAD